MKARTDEAYKRYDGARLDKSDFNNTSLRVDEVHVKVGAFVCWSVADEGSRYGGRRAIECRSDAFSANIVIRTFISYQLTGSPPMLENEMHDLQSRK